MKKLILSTLTLITITTLTATSAFAALPVCGPGVASGDKCTIGTTTHYSCGDGSYVKAVYGPQACGGSRVNQNGDPIVTNAQDDRTKQSAGDNADSSDDRGNGEGSSTESARDYAPVS